MSRPASPGTGGRDPRPSEAGPNGAASGGPARGGAAPEEPGTERPGTGGPGAGATSGRAVRPAGVRPAPWVRTRLRAAPLTTLLGAALVFVTVLLAAGLPRAVDRGADQALRSFLQAQGPGPTSLFATTSSQGGPQTPQELDSALAALRARTGGAFRLAASGPVHGAYGMKPRDLANPGLARIEGPDPRLTLVHLPEVASHASLVAGRWPSGPVADDAPVPVALSRAASETLKAPIGTVLESRPLMSGPVRAEVVGLYDVADAADVYWTDLPCLAYACKNRTTAAPPRAYWQTGAVVGAEGIDRISGWGEGTQYFWRLPVDTGALRADRLPATAKEVASFVAGPTSSGLSRAIERPDLRIASRLPELFAQAEARQQGAAPLAAIGPAGVAGVAVVVFALAAALGGDRRAVELRLLLARGGSRRSIVLRLLGEGAVTVLPAAAAATWLALVLLPTPRATASLAAASAVTLLALLALPVRAFVLLSGPRTPRPRGRLVAEFLVLVATAAAVYEVRTRGVAPAGAGLDPLLVAAPLLLALCGGLVLARLQPPLVGALARMAGRGPGLVGFLGLARAARGGLAGAGGGRGRPSVLPLIALLLAVTTGGFGATVLGAVDASRLQVAREAVGGDAYVAAPDETALPRELTDAAGALPGVRTATSAWVDDDAFVFGFGRGAAHVSVVVVDPESYAELSRTLGRGRFDPAALSKGGTSGNGASAGGADAVVPALISRDLLTQKDTAGQADGETFRLWVGGEEIRVGSAGTFEGRTPALPGAGAATLILPAGPAGAVVPKAAQPNRWLALGRIDGDRLEELVARTVPGATAEKYLVRTSAAKVAELSGDPLQHSAGRLFWASVAGAAGFAVLAVLLTLMRAAPDRAALLARLRTMGLQPRRGVALILAETWPQALVAALGGGLVAAAAVLLLGPAVDLSSLVGAEVPTGLGLAAGPVLTQALGIAALVTVAVLAEAAVSGRRQITTELRAGDQR
ncbi:hypothetical protein ACIGFK_20880 [Streptomyces sp. NPDC085524]|uniref:hypothetical protein n=1 Tax=unclassified Streptomyces TaxID=2593676 RepID=UPI0036805AFA